MNKNLRWKEVEGKEESKERYGKTNGYIYILNKDVIEFLVFVYKSVS